MEDSGKMLDVAEPTMEETEKTEVAPEENANENNNELEFTDSSESKQEDTSKKTEESTVDSTEQANETKVEKQSKEENSKYAQARRKAEAEMEAKIKEAYQKGRMESFIGKLNPYTNTPINDETDIQVYENMYALDKQGKDPVADYAGYVADKQRQELKEKQEKERLQQEAESDIAEFTEKYPDVNLSELLENETFKDYIEGKRKPLTALYENYKKMENSFRNKAVDVAKQTIANSQATPGSLNSGAEVNVDYSTMSDAEFERILNAVKNGEMK